MADATGAYDGSVTEWVTFTLAGEKYGIPVIQVREVLKSMEIAPVPGAPDFVLGIINVRGNVVTVVDTRRRFSMPSVELNDASRIMIVEEEGGVVGLVVDAVADVATLNDSDVEAAPDVGNDISARYLHGVTKWDGDLLILINLGRFLSLSDYCDDESE